MTIEGVFCFVSLAFLLALLLVLALSSLCDRRCFWFVNDLDTLFAELGQTFRKWVIANQSRELIARTQEDIKTVTEQYLEEVQRNARR